MENQHVMLFICLVAPLSMMLFVFKGKAKALIGFLLSGILMCLFAGELNTLLLYLTGLPMRDMTINITPIIEEILKAFPVVFIAFLMKPERQFLLEGAVAVGVGFALLENFYILLDSAQSLSLLLMLARGFGSGIMHGVSTLAVGYSMGFVSKDKKLSYTGTIAALSLAIIYHSIYNIMVQSSYPAIGIVMPMISFILILVEIGRK